MLSYPEIDPVALSLGPINVHWYGLTYLAGLSIGLLYLLARPYVGRSVALIASLLGVYHFGLYVLSVATVSETLYTTLLLAVLLLWTRRLEHPLTAPEARPGTRGPCCPARRPCCRWRCTRPSLQWSSSS